MEDVHARAPARNNNSIRADLVGIKQATCQDVTVTGRNAPVLALCRALIEAGHARVGSAQPGGEGPNAMSARAESASPRNNEVPDASKSYVTDGREAIGFVLARGRKGHEAFTVDEHSLGLFETAAKAANAVFDAAASERP
jgi:hypothetical protein